MKNDKSITDKIIYSLIIFIIVTVVAILTKEKWVSIGYTIILAIFPNEIRGFLDKVIHSKWLVVVLLVVIVLLILGFQRFFPNKISDTCETAPPTCTIKSISMPTETASIPTESEINVSEENSESAPTNAENVSAAAPEEELIDFSDVTVGDIIDFGSYKAQGDRDSEKEVVKWLVLKRDDDKFLVISQCGLDTKPYHFDRRDGQTTWAESGIRNWLNNYFYEEAFSEIEKKQIKLTNVQPDENSLWEGVHEDDTSDYVFLMSVGEVSRYIETDLSLTGKMCCKPTDSAKTQKIYIDQFGYGWWWLRNLTHSNTVACRIRSNGTLDTNEKIISEEGGLVRPAMWISLE